MSEPKPTDVLWEQTLEGVFHCRVVRMTDRYGHLTVTDTRFTNTVILDREVPLAHGAIFGADVDDVEEWMVLAEAAVDGDTINERETT